MAMGFAAAVTQTAVLRELLVMFSGFEPALGLALSCWLLWTAAGSALARRPGARPFFRGPGLVWLLSLMALLLPATVLFIRAWRMFWALPPGELPGLGGMLAACLAAPGPFCLASGFTFVCLWSAAADQGGLRPLWVFMGEALGAALGGLVFTFLLLPWLCMFEISLVAGLMVLAGAAVVALSGSGVRGAARWLVCPAAVLVLAAALPMAEDIELASRQWQWGRGVLEVVDSPFQNLALTVEDGQYSVFTGGAWLFTAPDEQGCELATHLALLQHPAPEKVLCVGGDLYGLAPEVLKHPTVAVLDFVDPDPALLDLAARALPAEMTSAALDPRVRVFHQDAASFLRRRAGSYDVVLLNLGDPVSAQANRFFTLEFYERMNRVLGPRGVLSFAASSSPEALGPLQLRHLRAIQATLAAGLGRVLVIPGDQARFFASPGAELTDDYRVLTERIQERGLDLRYVRDYYLFDSLNPFRLEAFKDLVASGRPERLNRTFEPACYFNSLALMAAKLSSRLKAPLLALADLDAGWALGLAGAAGLLLALMPLRGGAGLARAARAGVFAAGAAGMAFEVALLLGYQMARGNLYGWLAMITAAYMSGLALGAGLAMCARLARRARTWLAVSLAGMFLILCLSPLALVRLEACALGPGLVDAAFLSLALVFGVFGGLQFSMAAMVVSRGGTPGPAVGGGLYALDLAGAMVGATIVSLVLVPLFGLCLPLVLAGLLILGSLIVLGRAVSRA